MLAPMWAHTSTLLADRAPSRASKPRGRWDGARTAMNAYRMNPLSLFAAASLINSLLPRTPSLLDSFQSRLFASSPNALQLLPSLRPLLLDKPGNTLQSSTVSTNLQPSPYPRRVLLFALTPRDSLALLASLDPQFENATRLQCGPRFPPASHSALDPRTPADRQIRFAFDISITAPPNLPTPTYPPVIIRWAVVPEPPHRSHLARSLRPIVAPSLR